VNARRYPRTALEAFKGPAYASAIERPAPNPYPKALWLAMAAGFIVAILAGLDRI
jgi:hypothetical protein